MCHIVYLQNFSALWPLISLSSISFIASCFFVIADHFLWFFYFSRITNEARHQRTYRGPAPHVLGFTEIASFFGICVWLAPLFLFLSLSANDNALPVSAGMVLIVLSKHRLDSVIAADPGSPSGASPIQYAQSRVSLFRSVFSFEGLPRVRPKVSRRSTMEGLLAPHSPNPLSTPIPPPSPSLASRYSAMTPPPPRSPGPPKTQEDSHSLSSSQSFKLGTPPRRLTQPLRRQMGASVEKTGVGLGLGLRRSISSTTVDEDNMHIER